MTPFVVVLEYNLTDSFVMKPKILVLAPQRIGPSILVLREGKLCNVLNAIQYGGMR